MIYLLPQFLFDVNGKEVEKKKFSLFLNKKIFFFLHFQIISVLGIFGEKKKKNYLGQEKIFFSFLFLSFLYYNMFICSEL